MVQIISTLSASEIARPLNQDGGEIIFHKDSLGERSTSVLEK